MSVVRQFCTEVCEEKIWEREAEESPLLEAVARERVVKTQQSAKGLACAVVSFTVWRLAVALQLLVLTSPVYKWSINPFTNPNPVYGHTLQVAMSLNRVYKSVCLAYVWTLMREAAESSADRCENLKPTVWGLWNVTCCGGGTNSLKSGAQCRGGLDTGDCGKPSWRYVCSLHWAGSQPPYMCRGSPQRV
jgi:hypothetical protein